jgi:hypothetical protein
MKITRRSLAAAALAPGAILSQPSAKPATPDEELAAARQRLKSAAEALDKFDIEITVEPAFVFRV